MNKNEFLTPERAALTLEMLSRGYAGMWYLHVEDGYDNDIIPQVTIVHTTASYEPYIAFTTFTDGVAKMTYHRNLTLKDCEKIVHDYFSSVVSGGSLS